jgi:hypothetical protein
MSYTYTKPIFHIPPLSGAGGNGPIEHYVLADIYAWLEAHSDLSHSYVTSTVFLATFRMALTKNNFGVQPIT